MCSLQTRLLGRAGALKGFHQKTFPGCVTFLLKPSAISRALSSSVTYPLESKSSALRSPTNDDADALFELLGRREGSLVTDAEAVNRYNVDWTVSFLTDAEAVNRYNVDWTRKYIGHSRMVVRPKSTNEVSKILSYCNDERIGVVPQAGNTGLVGGSTPVSDEIILSVEGLNQVHAFDDDNGILTCDAGCILQSLHDYANERDHLVPIDLGAKGSCMIGGNVSTNAGGQYFYRFGGLHANILGLELVLANGKVLDLMNANRKDNTGLDMKHLFIGAEGTLGVVTKVVLSCPRLPKARNAAFLALGTFDDVRRALALAKEELGETLAAFEMMDKEVVNLVAAEKNLPLEASESCGFYVLVEVQGSNREHDEEKMGSFLEKSMEIECVADGVLAQDVRQVMTFWDIRESCNPCVKESGYNYKYDLSIPISQFEDVIEEMKERLKVRPDALVMNWGHVIDGNLHFNVTTPGNFEKDEEILDLLEPYVFETVVRRGGSISAEHGLGRCKNEYLGSLAKDPVSLDAMLSIKSIFDPNGIINPGKYFPAREGIA